MEPEIKEFLVRIVKSLSMAVLWMLVNMTLGIFLSWGFIHESISLGNILFYIFLVGSFSALVWYLVRIWKAHLQL